MLYVFFMQAEAVLYGKSRNRQVIPARLPRLLINNVEDISRRCLSLANDSESFSNTRISFLQLANKLEHLLNTNYPDISSTEVLQEAKEICSAAVQQPDLCPSVKQESASFVTALEEKITGSFKI